MHKNCPGFGFPNAALYSTALGVLSQFFIQSSYLTDSTNSVFSQHFVIEQQMCGDVSYDTIENAVAGYTIQFSGVDRECIDRIRPDFDMLINR